MEAAAKKITENGYELCSVTQFLAKAPKAHLERYSRDLIGHGSFIIWDQNDDSDGFMVCAPSREECIDEFFNHFGEFVA